MIDNRLKSACKVLALVAARPTHSFVTPTSLASRGTNVAKQSNLILSYNHDDGSALTESFSFLSLAELRRLLLQRGVHFRESMGKNELMDILKSSQASDVENDFDTPLQSFYSQEQSLISVFKLVSPAVANIKTEGVPQQQNFQPPGMGPPVEGTGSGFLWDNVVSSFVK